MKSYDQFSLIVIRLLAIYYLGYKLLTRSIVITSMCLYFISVSRDISLKIVITKKIVRYLVPKKFCKGQMDELYRYKND